MLEINLLPWRIEKTKKEKKAIRHLLIICLLVTMTLLMIWHYWLLYQKQLAEQELNQLRGKIQQVKEKLMSVEPLKIKLSTENQIKEWLAFYQYFLSMMQAFAVPNQFVCMTQVVHKNHDLLLYGVTHSAQALTQFLLHWPLVKLFSEIQVENITQKNQQFSFLLRAKEVPKISLQ